MPPDEGTLEPSRIGATKVAIPVDGSIVYKPGDPAAPHSLKAPHNIPSESKVMASIPSMPHKPSPWLGTVTPVHTPKGPMRVASPVVVLIVAR